MRVRRLDHMADLAASPVRWLDTAVSPGVARFERVILPAGTWQVGDERWTVTRQMLDQIVEGWQRGQPHHDCPVLWGHRNDPRQRAGRVLAIRRVGDELIAEIAVDAQHATQLESVAAPGVSVEVSEDWRDGRGQTYPLMLTHLALVNHPVVGNSGQFRRLSVRSGNSRRLSEMKRFAVATNQGKITVRQLMVGEETAEDEDEYEAESMADVMEAVEEDMAEEAVEEVESTPSATEADGETIMALVQELLALSGYPGLETLPEGTTDENVIDRLRAILDIMRRQKEAVMPAESAADADTMSADQVESLPDPPAMTPQQLAIGYRGLRAGLAKVLRRLELTQQARFADGVATLIKSQVISAADRDALTEAGKASKWSLAILQPFRRQLGETLSTKSRTLANRQTRGQRLPNGLDPRDPLGVHKN